MRGEEGLDPGRQAGYDGGCQAGEYIVSMVICVASCAAWQASDPLLPNIPWSRSSRLIRWMTYELDSQAEAPAPQ